MIAKGNLHGNGPKLINYILSGQNGERAEFIGARGFDDYSPDLESAAARMQQFAGATTRAEKPWFHVQTRLAPGEQLSSEQWERTLDREEKRLGFTGLPRISSFHIDEATGERHLHGAWFRIDAETGLARDPGLFKLRLMEVARGCEIEFALQEVSNHRKPDDLARGADRNETEEARRLGTDVRATRTAILDCLEHADGGKGFKAALEERGMMLANGDRRDCFVVIDQAGGQHALNKKLTGITLAAMRERMADLDRTQLPGVEQAQQSQMERQADRALEVQPAPTAAREKDDAAARGGYSALHEAGRQAETKREFAADSTRTTEPQAPIWDRDAANAEWAAKIEDAALGREGAAPSPQESRQQPNRSRQVDSDAPTAQGRYDDLPVPEPASQQRPEDIRPIGKTAGDIRTAWALSRSAEQFEDGLAARGITLAEVSGEEARQSQRTAAFAKEVGNFARALKEGEIVAVNAHGDVHRFDARSTGDAHPDIEARFPGLDRAGLLNVADTKEVIQEASRAIWRDERRAEWEKARPATGIETAIADALTATMTGKEFAAALDKAGITIARADDRDVQALDALRQDAALASIVAQTESEPVATRHFAAIDAGDFAAVNRQGDVFRLTPHKLDLHDIERRLADHEPRMPTVIEARAQNEIDRENTSEFWTEMRAWNAEQRATRNDAFEGDKTLHRQVDAAEHGVESTLHVADDAVNAGFDAASGLASGFASAVLKVLEGFFSFFGLGEPKLTPMQAELSARANEELADARAVAAAAREIDVAQDWQIFENDRQQQQEEMQRDMGYRPDDRDRERTRDWL